MVVWEDANSDDDGWLLRVTDFRQYAYCRRVVYFEYCLPGLRPTTYKMEAGIAAQEKVVEREERRSLRAYGLRSGTRHFDVRLTSSALRCTGQADMVIETDESGAHRLIPVDFKLSRRQPGVHFRLQLACYALMLEENWGLPAPEGYIYLTPLKEAVRVAITKRLCNQAVSLVEEMRLMVEEARMPAATAKRGQCVNCEFRRFCGDVV